MSDSANKIQQNRFRYFFINNLLNNNTNLSVQIWHFVPLAHCFSLVKMSIQMLSVGKKIESDLAKHPPFKVSSEKYREI